MLIFFFTQTFLFQTCIEKESVLRKENHQVINLTTEYVWAGCRLTKLDNTNEFDMIGGIITGDTQKYSCQASRSFRSARERWWYIVLDNCNADKVGGVLLCIRQKKKKKKGLSQKLLAKKLFFFFFFFFLRK